MKMLLRGELNGTGTLRTKGGREVRFTPIHAGFKVVLTDNKNTIREVFVEDFNAVLDTAEGFLR